MCMRVKPNYFQMRMLGIFHRIIKSVMFNVAMFVSGFVTASILCICIVHGNATRNDQYGYVNEIGSKLKEFRVLEGRFSKTYDELEDMILQLKQRMSHDECNIDEIVTR